MENQYSYYKPEQQNDNTKFTGGREFNEPTLREETEKEDAESDY